MSEEVEGPKATWPESPPARSFYERVSRLLGLTVAPESEVDLMELLERGLPATTVQTLRTLGALTEQETYTLIAPRRTLSRRESARQALTRDEADRAVRIARVTARAQQVFSARPEYAGEWLREPKSALAGRTPIQALATGSGALAVEELLIAVEYGLCG